MAGGATFAAFPEWYATLFSGFYLPLLLILVGADHPAGGHRLPQQAARAGLAAALGRRHHRRLGRARAALGRRLRQHPPRRADRRRRRSTSAGFVNLLNPFALLTGLVTLTLFLTHGAVFVALKTDGDHPASGPTRVAGRIGLLAAVLTVALGALAQPRPRARRCQLGAERGRRASGCSAAWPPTAAAARAGPSSARRRHRLPVRHRVRRAVPGRDAEQPRPGLEPDHRQRLVDAVHADDHDLAAAIATPLVIGYQAWTYWVFRKRLTVGSIPDDVHRAPAPRRPGDPRRPTAPTTTTSARRPAGGPVDPRLWRRAAATRRYLVAPSWSAPLTAVAGRRAGLAAGPGHRRGRSPAGPPTRRWPRRPRWPRSSPAGRCSAG